MSKVTKTTVKRIVNFLHLTNEMFSQSMIMLKHILCKTLTELDSFCQFFLYIYISSSRMLYYNVGILPLNVDREATLGVRE
jgi:serine phosphatase RsbU (regulator of sigma subunit)